MGKQINDDFSESIRESEPIINMIFFECWNYMCDREALEGEANKIGITNTDEIDSLIDLCLDSEYPKEYRELIKKIIKRNNKNGRLKSTLDELFNVETDIKTRGKIISSLKLKGNKEELDFIQYICQKYIDKESMGEMKVHADDGTENGAVFSRPVDVKGVFSEILRRVKEIEARRNEIIAARKAKKPKRSKRSNGKKITTRKSTESLSYILAQQLNGAPKDSRNGLIKRFKESGEEFDLNDAVSFIDPTKNIGKEILIELLNNKLITGQDLIKYINDCEPEQMLSILRDLIAIRQAGYFNGKPGYSDALTEAYVREMAKNGH